MVHPLVQAAQSVPVIKGESKALGFVISLLGLFLTVIYQNFNNV